MTKKLLALLVMILSYTTSLVAAPYVFDYTPGCQKAYQQYLSLNLPEGNALIRHEMMANPYNLRATYIA